MWTTRRSKLLLGVLLALLAGVARGAAQDSAPTVEELEVRLQELEASTAENKSALTETFKQALGAAQRAREARTRARAFASDASDAPALLGAIRDELALPPAEPELVAEPSLTLAEVEARAAEADAALQGSRAQVDELGKTIEFRAARAAELPKDLIAAQEALGAAQEALDATPASPEAQPRRVLLLAQVDEFSALVAAFEAERDCYEARRDLLPLRRDRALRRRARAEKVATFWSAHVGERRKAEGDAAAAQANEQLEAVIERFPALEKLATEAHDLAAMRSGEGGLPQRIARAQAELDVTVARLDEVNRRFRVARRRIKAGGLTESMGITLRRDNDWLPRPGGLRAEAERREELLSVAQLELITIEEGNYGAAGDLATAVSELLAGLGEEQPSEQLVETARKLIIAQREAQDNVLGDLGRLTSTFYLHKELSNELLASARAYRDFIEERILWVRSAPAIPLARAGSIPGYVAALARSISPSALLRGLESCADRRPFSVTLVAALLFAVLAGRNLLKRKRDEMGAFVRSYRSDKYVYTLRALVQTLLLALPPPLLVWSIGWVFLSTTGPSSTPGTDSTPGVLEGAIGAGLQESALAWLVLRFLRGILAEKGVGQTHFKWPASRVAALRAELNWFGPLAIGLSFVAITLDAGGERAWSDSLGRLCFVAEMVVLTVFAYRILHTESELWAASSISEKSLLKRTRRLWTVVALGLPVALAVLAILGYYYTALQFELRVRYSLGFALGLALINALLLRWLYITRRRLAVNQALEAKARREGEPKTPAADTGTAAIDWDKLDIPAVDAQTRQLFKSSITIATVIGIYFIWASVLPALQGLDRVQLLPAPALLSSEQVVADVEPPRATAAAEEAPSAASLPGIPAPTPGAASDGAASALGLPSTLTLADVMLAIVFLLLTMVAARNLPALLELALLQRLPLDGGARYAVSTIARYLILLVGASAITGALGVGWQQIQWLAAALTFGLAFGLQEIFANFVSGLIILIERPIRVGDVVTIGETEGRVTRLRMRATTIQDKDRRELVVPNKEFITGSVINWSLSDPVTRVIVPVGIAYGSDIAKARALLLASAAACPLALKDPAPNVIFMRFGESSLDFELRAYLQSREHWPELIDSLHVQIDTRFRAENIEIAFPQRDIHVRSVVGSGAADDDGEHEGAGAALPGTQAGSGQEAT
jgi:potassium efflux system protein